MLEEAAVSIFWVAIKTDMIEMPVPLPVSCCCLSIFHIKSSGSPLGYGGRGCICDSGSGPHASSLQDTLQQNQLLSGTTRRQSIYPSFILCGCRSPSHAFSPSLGSVSLFLTPSPPSFPTPSHSLNMPLHGWSATST